MPTLKPFLKNTNKMNAAMVKAPEHTHVVIPLEDLDANNPLMQLFDGKYVKVKILFFKQILI